MLRSFVLAVFLIISLKSFPIHTQENASEEHGFSFDINYRSIKLPAEIRHNLVIISMRINNSPPLNFILDTGVNTTILTEPLIANFFDFSIDQTVYVLGLGNEGIIEAGLSKNLTFNLEGITGRNMNLVILPEGLLSFSEIFGFPVHGIIGYDLLKEFPVMINYQRSFVRIYREPTYRVGWRSKSIPLNIINNKPYIDVHVEGQQGQEIADSLELLVDLGATNPLFLNQSYKNLVPEYIPAYLGKGLSGHLEGKLGRLKSLSFSDYTLDEPLVAFPQQEFLSVANVKHEWQGIIGGGILSRFRIIVDYQSEKLVLRKNRSFGDPFRSNTSGIEVIVAGHEFNNFIVSYVRENSAGYEQNIMVGDTIIGIQDENIQKMSVEDVISILNKAPGETVELDILRSQNIYRKKLKLREDI